MIPVQGPFEFPIPTEKQTVTEFLPSKLPAAIDTTAWRSWQSELENLYVETQEIDYRIAWASVELLTGDPGLALLVLEPLQAAYPARTDVHLLLSVAYEKTGRHKKALASAERFYKLRPGGCAQTSKLHMSWLKVAADPLVGPEKILNTRVDVYLEDYRKTKATPANIKQWEIRKADIWNLLHQRIVLFSKPDVYMGQVMLDMGDYHYLTGEENTAALWYEEALSWNPNLKDKVDERFTILSKNMRGLKVWLGIGAIVALTAIFLVYKIKPVQKSA
jgi:tetratricopeptide (TPR) repeat protein